ncbi:hypothetical protein [Noviherbaspirillum saxi]|uniref:Uncharacterized protein n=1 Tax=Noviherbaspirillum saxi TaxID=2320863 RepID=A0A3A3FIK2_9BURK|nr:hypothetical protein [Noviherbaspirillum saxi]RJF95323.1 hypothetical protein D3871_17985 [Noviherbaspirillum saxi]
MKVQVIHENANGERTEFGIYELPHMPPVAEPFPVNSQTFYLARAYFGPDEDGMYQLILEGEPGRMQ